MNLRGTVCASRVVVLFGRVQKSSEWSELQLRVGWGEDCCFFADNERYLSGGIRNCAFRHDLRLIFTRRFS